MGFEDYKGSIALGAGLKKAGTSDYPLMQAGDIQAEEGGKRLDVVLAEMKGSSTSVTVNGTHQQSFEADTKVDKTDIADDLETEDASKVLSAYQGVTLKNAILEAVNNAGKAIDGAVGDAVAVANAYTDGKVEGKLDKISLPDDTNAYLYMSYKGNQGRQVLSKEAVNGAVVSRKGENIVLPATIGDDDNYAVSKKFVNDAILEAVSNATGVIEGAVAQAIETANSYTDEALKEVSIDDSNYAKKSESNSFSLFQTFAGSMPTTTEYNTTVVGQTVRVVGSKDKDYDILLGGTLVDAGFIKAYSDYWGCKIELNATSVAPAIVVSSMSGNDRTFTFPSEGGLLATEGTVDKKLANLKTGGSKIYKHSFTYEGHNYEMLSLSSSSMTDINTFMDHIGNILSLACTSTNLMYAGTNIFSISFSAIEWNPNTGIATTKEFYISIISNYSCKEV